MSIGHAPAIDFDTASIESGRKKPSMIYNVLPTVVQNRIPTLPSLRRTITDIRGRTVTVKSEPLITEVFPPESPPPGYTSRPSTSGTNDSSSRTSIASNDGDILFQEAVSWPPGSSLNTPPPFPISEMKTGINWKYANQGLSLATQAYAESQSLKADETSTVLTRQLYVHGMTYLLRGLPLDLTPEEMLSLQAAVPQSMIVLQNEPCNRALVPYTQVATAPQPPPEDASLLHRITATFVFQTFVMIQFLLPYMKLFIGHAYQFEREHKVTQRLVNNGIMTADVVRRRGLQLSHTICQMNDGKVGQALNNLTLWWVRGLTGGLQQGIMDGVTMMGDERPRNTKGRVEKVE